MAGIAALVLFVLAFILHGAGASVPVWINPSGLLYAGLACLTLHLLGPVSSWPWRRQP